MDRFWATVLYFCNFSNGTPCKWLTEQWEQVLEFEHNTISIASSQWLKSKVTMLQKLSKCEVEAWICWNLIIFPPLRFYVKSNFSKFKQSKNVTFGNFRDFALWILVNLVLESCSKFRVSKFAKNDIFGPLEFVKIWFHVKSERR